MYTKDHQRRVNEELIHVGLTRYALLKNEVRHLPHIIHDDEHIMAAINGRSATGSVMLVATDKRVVFLDCKSFYTTSDEISYDVVAGVMYHVQGLYANVILHTRVGEYNLRLVNKKQAIRFVQYIEEKRLEAPYSDVEKEANKLEDINLGSLKPLKLDKNARNFLQTHNIGVLSTIDRGGSVHGATVYYAVDQESIYFLTKSETTKAKNILAHPQIALTIFEDYTLQSLQIKGMATMEHNQEIANRIYAIITKELQYDSEKTTTPVTKILEGFYVVFKVIITEAKYQKFK